MQRLTIMFLVSFLAVASIATCAHASEKKFLQSLSRQRRSADTQQQPALGLLGSTTKSSKSCMIEVQEVRRIPGKCIRLLGGTPACQSDEWLDPINSYCRGTDDEED